MPPISTTVGTRGTTEEKLLCEFRNKILVFLIVSYSGLADAPSKCLFTFSYLVSTKKL
ncbi:hypothetical protein PGB90_009889 [Kerria lacca]